MKHYDCYIFDIDGTLLDYRAAERYALKRIFSDEGMLLDDKTLSAVEARDDFWWGKNGLYQENEEWVQLRYHELYEYYLLDFFSELREMYGFLSSNEELICKFRNYLSAGNFSYSEVECVLKKLSGSAKIYAATNGFETVQRARMSKLACYFEDMFISETIGLIKPNRGFWGYVFDHIPFAPNACLMVGDSLTNDIKSAHDFGMDTFLVNRKDRPVSDVATYTAVDLSLLLN